MYLLKSRFILFRKPSIRYLNRYKLCFLLNKSSGNNLEKLFNKLGIKRGNKIILHSNAAGLFQYINKKDSL